MKTNLAKYPTIRGNGPVSSSVEVRDSVTFDKFLVVLLDQQISRVHVHGDVKRATSTSHTSCDVSGEIETFFYIKHRIVARDTHTF